MSDMSQDTSHFPAAAAEDASMRQAGSAAMDPSCKPAKPDPSDAAGRIFLIGVAIGLACWLSAGAFVLAMIYA